MFKGTTILGSFSVVALAVASAACASTTPPPQDLVNARAEMVRAKSGPTNQIDPTDVHTAELALQRAEQSFSDDPDSPETLDLAAIADLSALSAEATAGALAAQAQKAQATQALATVQAQQLQNAQGRLAATQGTLAATQGQLNMQTQETAEEHARRMDAEAKLKDARDTLARIAAVTQDDRGLIVTFQGEALFTTGTAKLLPAAMVKLDQVAQTLMHAERHIVVNGYTDSVGGVGSYNQQLSEKRADAVRDYLVSKGLPSDLVTAVGHGAADFVADNSTIEGRAANRRVEIVVQPKNGGSSDSTPGTTHQ